MNNVFRTMITAMTLVTVISGCNSSSSSNSGTGSTTGIQLSGTVAAGAPLVGTITAIDSTGTTVTTPATIGVDGTYTLDVSNLTAPYLVHATGTSAGVAYNLYTLATAADVTAGVINVTPITDLILANAAGTSSSVLYSTPTTITTIDDTKLSSAKSTLASRLNAIFTAAGIDPTLFDIRNGQFTANHTGFDAVLDILEVTVDETNHRATIKNRLDTTQVINDDLTTDTDNDQLATGTANISLATTALGDVDGLLSDFEHLLKNASTTNRPTPSVVQSYLATTFSHNGYTYDTYSTFVANATDSDYTTLEHYYDQHFKLKSYDATLGEMIITFEDGSDFYLTNNGSIWSLDGNHVTTAQ